MELLIHFINTFVPEEVPFIPKYSHNFVWIIGDSIVKHGGDYAMKLGCEQVGQTRHQIVWLGKSSMRWEQLLPSLQLQMITRGQPRMIIIHLGGNNVDSYGSN